MPPPNNTTTPSYTSTRVLSWHLSRSRSSICCIM